MRSGTRRAQHHTVGAGAPEQQKTVEPARAQHIHEEPKELAALQVAAHIAVVVRTVAVADRTVGAVHTVEAGRIVEARRGHTNSGIATMPSLAVRSTVDRTT